MKLAMQGRRIGHDVDRDPLLVSDLQLSFFRHRSKLLQLPNGSSRLCKQ